MPRLTLSRLWKHLVESSSTMAHKSTSSHPWHDLPLGDDAPNICNAVIEIPRGVRCALWVRMAAWRLAAVHATRPCLQARK